MKWFEEHVEHATGSSEGPQGNYEKIAQLADEALDGTTMVQFVREFFLWQKRFGEYLGVGESTVAGWMKSETFPDYAKRAALAAYYARKYFRQLRGAEQDTTQPKVVKDGDRYLIVRFRPDEAGMSVGEILARDIATEKAALVFAGGLRAWQLLGEVEEHLDDEIEAREGENSEHLVSLRDEIRAERARVFNHEGLLESERLARALDIDLGDGLPFGDAADDAEHGAPADRSEKEAE